MPRKKTWKRAAVKKKKTGVLVLSDGGVAHPFSSSAEEEPSVSMSKTGVLVVSDGGLAHPFSSSAEEEPSVSMSKTGVLVVSDGGVAHPFSSSAEEEPSVSMSKTGVLVVSDGGLAHPFSPSGASVSQSLPCNVLDSFSCSVLEENLDSFHGSNTECKPMDISEENLYDDNTLKQKDSVLEFNAVMNDPKEENIGNPEVHLRKPLAFCSQECVYYATPVIDNQSSGIEVFDPSFNGMFGAEKVIFGSFHEGDAMFREVS